MSQTKDLAEILTTQHPLAQKVALLQIARKIHEIVSPDDRHEETYESLTACWMGLIRG